MIFHIFKKCLSLALPRASVQTSFDVGLLFVEGLKDFFKARPSRTRMVERFENNP